MRMSLNEMNGHGFHVLLLVGLSSAMLSCGELVPPDLELSSRYHVFGVRAEPPVVRPDDRVILTMYDHHPSKTDLHYSWSVCLYSHGATSHYKCVNDELLLGPLTSVTPRIEIDLSSTGVDLRTRLLALGQVLDVEGQLRTLEEGLDIFIIVDSGDPDEGLIRTVKRLHVIDEPGDEPLAENPEIKGWRIEETGIASPFDPCEMTMSGSESLITRTEEGEIRGIERSEVIQEVSGIPQVGGENLDPSEPTCVLHTGANLKVILNTVGPYVDASTDEESYTFRWYSSIGQRATTPITVGGAGFGQYLLERDRRFVELLFTVRGPHGGFTMGRQKLNLVPSVLVP